jgi:hypothetical protein
MVLDPVALQNAVNDFTDFLLRYFIALAAVGALAMALMELWKKIRASEMRYQSAAVTAWIQGSGAAFEVSRRPPGTDQELSKEQAYSELLQLTTGVTPGTADTAAKTLIEDGGVKAEHFWVKSRDEHAVFALPLERMMGHVQDAAESALNTPKRYPSLYLFFTSGAAADDVKKWFDDAQAMPKPARVDAAQEGSGQASGITFDRDEAKSRADLYARLHQLVRRKLDGFQAYAERRWVNWNQLWANVVGALVLFAALMWGRDFDTDELPTIILFSLLGGVLSPVAKDVVVALRKVRGG